MATIFEEYRLIERDAGEINVVWKGAHRILFFLAFIFGSFCTFCFHVLMYMFDDKCVLFPRLLSLTNLRHDIIYEFIPQTIGQNLDDLPVDFVTTQWVDQSTCAFPTYVPLVSGIFGLVWTTIFFMFTTGSRSNTSLQHPWRVLPIIFIFSTAMSILCCYTSVITESGLNELCSKLGELSGSNTCSYTVNVVTLSYERRIRGVYQAIKLTIWTAWLHTLCWVCSALLTIIRVLLVVDFKLVRITVKLHGDIDKILEKQEIQLRSVSPDGSGTNEVVHWSDGSKLLYYSKEPMRTTSNLGLVPDEERKLARNRALKKVPKHQRFIVKYLYDFVDQLILPGEKDVRLNEIYENMNSSSGSVKQSKQSLGDISVQKVDAYTNLPVAGLTLDQERVHEVVTELCNRAVDTIAKRHEAQKTSDSSQLLKIMSSVSIMSKQVQKEESALNLTPQMKRIIEEKQRTHSKHSQKQSSLRSVNAQTDKRGTAETVRLESEQSLIVIHDQAAKTRRKKNKVDKETQAREKEKKD